MGFRFQKRLSILPGVRVNLSKGGVSTSLGPRGADVNIGRSGINTNAGIPGTGLSYRSKVGSKGGALGILALVAGGAFWAFQHWSKIEQATAPAPQIAQAVPVHPAVITPLPSGNDSANIIRFVHRNGSDLRDQAKTSGRVLKKESKGSQVTLIAEQDGWAQVKDGDLTGYMRASVLGTAPPP
jgi:hypothetical protein